MKKIISILCALSVICGISSVSFADETKGELSLNVLGYYDETWEVEKEAVDAAGDIVMLSINANDISDMGAIGTACDNFSALAFTIEYDETAIKPYMDTVYESTIFTAKYKAPNKKVPTSATEGIITTGSAGFTSNTAEPGYTPDGKTTMIINEGTAGFAVNGAFMTFYFEVVDPSKAGDITLTVDSIDFFDTAAGKLIPATVNGVSVDGMGAAVVVPSVDVEKGEVMYGESTYADKKTAGFATTVTPANGGVFTKLTAYLNNGTADGSVVVYEGTAIDAVTVFGLNITQVPADVAITVTDVVAE